MGATAPRGSLAVLMFACKVHIDGSQGWPRCWLCAGYMQITCKWVAEAALGSSIGAALHVNHM